jgi:hypothetical protein
MTTSNVLEVVLLREGLLGALEDHLRLMHKDVLLVGGSSRFHDGSQSVDHSDDHGWHSPCRLADFLERPINHPRIGGIGFDEANSTEPVSVDALVEGTTSDST